MRSEVRNTTLKSTFEIVSAMRRGKLGCLELLERHLDRVERFNPSLNAVVVMNAELARERARAARTTPSHVARSGGRSMAFP